MKLARTPEFEKWITDETAKSRAQIEDRLSRILDYGHFGDCRDLGDSLAELKWKNGRRIYFSKMVDSDGHVVILILGGNKNGQNKDIAKAKKILGRLKED